jgi:hypothetical protein
MIHPVPKPKKRKREPVKVYPDEREVCDLKTAEGKKEYLWRTDCMAYVQSFCCAICRRRTELFFDHEAGRGSGGGHRDDRIVVKGHRKNAALCASCNSEKGSKRYHWINGKYIPV